jgi:carbonic anhydrase
MQSPPTVTEAMAINSTMRLPIPSWGEAGFAWTRDGPLWTVQIAGNAITQWREEAWHLEAIQFRFPGEPFFGSTAPAGAVHMIHRKGDRRLILAAPMVGSSQAARHAALTTLMQRFPTDPEDRPDWSKLRLPLRSFLPASIDAGSVFPGSLSYPPCTEGVFWVLFDSPLILPPDQLRELEALLGRGHRPLQPTNARVVLRLQAAQP